MSANKVAQDFIKAINTQKQKPSAYDTKGEVMRITEGIAWVHLAGGIDETPCELTIGASVGDTVQVRVAGGRAWLVGNSTEPPVGDKHVQNIIKKEKKNIVKDVEEDTTTIINQKMENISVDDPRVIKVSHDPIITHHSVTFTAKELNYDGDYIDNRTEKINPTVKGITGKTQGHGSTVFEHYDEFLYGSRLRFQNSYKGLPVNVTAKYKVGASAFASPTIYKVYYSKENAHITNTYDKGNGWSSTNLAEQSLKNATPTWDIMAYDKSGIKLYDGYYQRGTNTYRPAFSTLPAGNVVEVDDASIIYNGYYQDETFYWQSNKDGGILVGIEIPNQNSWTMSFVAFGEVFDLRGFSGIQFDFDLVKL